MEREVQNLNRTTRITSNEKSAEDLLRDLLGKKYVAYREAWEESFDPRSKIRNFPIHIDLELQDFCNQSCKMCPRDSVGHPNLLYDLGTKVIGTTGMFLQVIREGSQKGLQSVNFGAFSEPLIHRGLWELISFAHEAGLVDSRVITNGLLLDRNIDNVFKSGLVNLFISLDALTKETYEKIRGKGFEKVVSNVVKVLEERKSRNSPLPIIRVSFVEMDVNRHEKDAFIDYWINKVDHVDIQKWSDYTRIANKEQLSQDKAFNCRSPWQRLSILANGEVLPCCDFNGRNLVIGSVKNSNLEEIWKSSKIERIRQGIVADSSPVCSSCQRCFGA